MTFLGLLGREMLRAGWGLDLELELHFLIKKMNANVGVVGIVTQLSKYGCVARIGQNRGVSEIPLPSAGLVKSKQRVADHGEVFTPSWMVEDMLELVKAESERIDSRFLEPACGSGNFLKSILKRKLMTVQARYGKSDFERRHHALFALMCIYGIELLKDNVEECRASLLTIYAEYLRANANDKWYIAGREVLKVNILQGDALTLTTTEGNPIEFPEWGYLGSGKFQRRDFRYDSLTQRSSFEGTLFETLEEHELFIPTRTHPPMNVEEIAQ